MTAVDRAARSAAYRGMCRTSDRIDSARGYVGGRFVAAKRDSVLVADARTSMCDYRILFSQAIGQPCDRNGYFSTSPTARVTAPRSAGEHPGGVEPYHPTAPPPGHAHDIGVGS